MSDDFMRIIKIDLERDYADQLIERVEIIDKEVKNDDVYVTVSLTTSYGFYVFKYIINSKTKTIKGRELTHAVPL